MLARIPWLPLFGYSGFFFASFVLFAYWTFPYERIADQYLQRFAAERGYRVSIGDVDPYWLTGVEIEDLELQVGDEDSQSIQVLEARARAGILALLGNGTDLSFSAELATGALSGSYETSEDSVAIQADLDNVRLEMISMVSDAVGLPLAGAANGHVDLALKQDPTESNGSINLSINKFKVGDGEAKINVPGVPALTVDTIEAGDLKLKLQIDKGVATLEELSSQGKDLELDGGGDIRLGKTLSTSRANINLRARFTDAYKKKTPRTEAMFSLMENSNSRQLKRAQTADGWLAFSMTGSLVKPRFVPGAPSARAPRRAGTR